ncbi:MAG: thioredoxin family protein [bacterium]|nr:thioredoxin family protein [bacterium]
MKNALIFLLASALLALPGLWLLLRQHGRRTLLVAIPLLLLATASSYTGIRLWQENPATPAFQLNTPPGRFQVIRPAELPAALAASHGRPVLLEFYADWCSSCVVWKTTVFNRPDVQAAMTPLQLLQIDASELGPDVQALLDQHHLNGLPAILVYDKNGQEHPELRLLGEMAAPDFIDWIKHRLLSSL